MTVKGKKAAEREKRRQAALARKRRRRTIILSGIGVVIVAAVLLALTGKEPPELANMETFPDMGRAHLEPGEAPPEYNSDPPTSGPHAPQAAPCGIHVSEVPDPLQVHNLEHGTVVVQYQPDLEGADLEALQDYARSKQSHILLAPRPGLSHPVVLTSWTRMLRLDTVDLDTIEVFFQRFSGVGPEAGVPCPFVVDEAA